MKPRAPFYITAIIVILLIAGAFYMFVDNFSFLTSTLFLATAIVAILLLLIISALSRLVDAEKFKKLSPEQQQAYLKASKQSYFTWLWNDAFNKKTQETDGEVKVLDHGFDGIKELDNLLPKWYLGLFGITIVYGVVYLIAYSFTDFAHADKEYDAEYAQQLEEIKKHEETTPQATLETTKFDPAKVADGQKVYDAYCVSCHDAGAKGNIGPNQTDDYWINIYQSDEFKNIFDVVWNGSRNNPSMVAFGALEQLKGNQIEAVASYLYDLNQKAKKNADGSAEGKEPQGDIAPWSENAQTELQAATAEGKDVKIGTVAQ
ncbi:MAG: c-type cytochrome [Flavobacteriaceae bacterium]|jgi:cytochrome c oxidase cbb3-type subunit 3|nr:c-type cytochrome [Flavobacteriaceae bacterium]